MWFIALFSLSNLLLTFYLFSSNIKKSQLFLKIRNQQSQITKLFLAKYNTRILTSKAI